MPRPRVVTNLCLTRYFTVVDMDDGSVGACMSYYRFQDNDLAWAEERLLDVLREDLSVVTSYSTLDRLLRAVLSDDRQRYYVLTSTLATVASALSAPVIRAGGDSMFQLLPKLPRNMADGASSALIVGFGGLMEHLTSESHISRVHVLEWLYHPEKDFYRSELFRLRAKFPEKTITVSRELEEDDDLSRYDVVSITGSTLCNGTLEELLENIRKDAYVILQGQSASVHPQELFDAGVRLVVTTLKPQELVQMARADRSGAPMRPLLDGGLPRVQLVPMGGSPSTNRSSNSSLSTFTY